MPQGEKHGSTSTVGERMGTARVLELFRHTTNNHPAGQNLASLQRVLAR